MLLRRDTFQGLCRALELLCAADEEAPSIEGVARAVAISPAHFIRQFQAVFGGARIRF